MKFTHSTSFGAEQLAADVLFANGSLTVSLYGPSDTDLTGELDKEFHPPLVNQDSPWGKAPLKLLGKLQATQAELTALSSWADRSVLLAGADARQWVNVTQQTFLSKERPTQFIHRTGLDLAPLKSRVMLLVPLKASTLDECTLHILTGHSDYPHRFNGAPVLSEQVSPMLSQAAAFPRIRLNTDAQVQVGATAVLDFTLTDSDGAVINRDCELYLQAIGGVLSSERASIIQGTGSVRVTALGVRAGDTIRIKAGWRYWTGETDFTLEVTA